MGKYKKVAMIVCSLGILLMLTGITYSFFNYNRVGSTNSLVTGDIYMHINEGDDEITLSNIFPETPEEARARNDNIITFTLDGLNESDKEIYYEIDLLHGNDMSGYTRFNDSDLRFDLIEVVNNQDNYLISNGNYDDLTNKRIWVDTVDANTLTSIERTYKLRMWLSDNVIISDSDPNATYHATGNNSFKSHFASIKIRVIGDFQEKTLPEAYYKIANNADLNTAINFGQDAIPQTGEGIFRLYGTDQDNYPIYFYRGDVDNNHVLFGGFCWQIVRTTDTGGVKMLYNGLPEITGSGDNITYNCGYTRPFQNTVRGVLQLYFAEPVYFADDYEIIGHVGQSNIYKLKSKNQPITSVLLDTNTKISSNSPIIAANYPYTCLEYSADATCTQLYKVDGYSSGYNAYVYSSGDLSSISRGLYNDTCTSVSDIGYMYNAVYKSTRGTAPANSIFSTNVEWNGTSYLLVDDTPGVASVNKTLDSTHHYTCAVANGSTCTSVRYYHVYNNSNYYYVTLSNGETIEDALYKLTGDGTPETKQRNTGYKINTTNSNAKTIIENWFKTNLTNEVNTSQINYQEYLEDTEWCNDRSSISSGSSSSYSLGGWNPNGGDLNRYLMFGNDGLKYGNYYSTTSVPILHCPNKTDQFSVGNPDAKLKYPIGLLTTDEEMLAGHSGNTSTILKSYYLYTGGDYFLFSPSTMSNYSSISIIGSYGGPSSSVPNIWWGIRPAVSLKLGVEFEEGGDGTPTNPYKVKYES